MSKYKPNRPDKYYSGEFKPKNIDKYMGDPTDIIYRSKWEYKFCLYCDNEEKILKWESEPKKHTIPYSVVENNNYVTKRYIPDFWIQMKNKNGELEEFIIEIKPHKETIEPVEPKKHSLKSLQNYEYSLKTYIKNINKWGSAEKYCNRIGINFFVLTEKYFEQKSIKLF